MTYTSWASDLSDSYNPVPTTTKSGRSVHKPTAYVPTIPSPTQTNSKRRKVGGRHSNARSVCKTCQRGHSPNANQIVFCDQCNTGYHQYCHHPPIENDVVLIQDKEWVCAACVRDNEGAPLPVVDHKGTKYFSGERWTTDEVILST